MSVFHIVRVLSTETERGRRSGIGTGSGSGTRIISEQSRGHYLILTVSGVSKLLNIAGKVYRAKNETILRDKEIVFKFYEFMCFLRGGGVLM